MLRGVDAAGFARVDPWSPGTSAEPAREPALPARGSRLAAIIDRAVAGRSLDEADIVALFDSRGDAFHAVCEAADALRAATRGDEVTYVVTRNINYTNICAYKCTFCAFSKGKLSENLRGRPYDLSLDEIQRRAVEAWERGGVEVCLQGGIHPSYDGNTYHRRLPRDQSGVPRHSHPCLLAAGGLAGRGDARASRCRNSLPS